MLTKFYLIDSEHKQTNIRILNLGQHPVLYGKQNTSTIKKVRPKSREKKKKPAEDQSPTPNTLTKYERKVNLDYQLSEKSNDSNRQAAEEALKAKLADVNIKILARTFALGKLTRTELNKLTMHFQQ